MKELIATLFIIGVTSATHARSMPGELDKIATCVSDDQKFELWRNTEVIDDGFMIFTDLDSSRIRRVPVSISYSNAGARAIVVHASAVPQLILLGNVIGSFPLYWSEIDWQCRARF